MAHEITQELIRTMLETNSGMKLLHARNADVVIAFLYQMFGDLQETSVEQDRFLGSLERFYTANELNDDDLDIQSTDDHATKAREALNAWIAKGYVLRSYSENVQEVISLSAGVGRLFRYLEDIQDSTKGIVGTDSRFSFILHQINELKEKTTDDPHQRIKALKARQEALQQEIFAIEERGVANTFSAVQIHERIEELERQCRSLLSDFRQLKDNNHELFLSICKKQLEATDSRGDILQYTMEGQNAISASPQGQSFDAFWNTLTLEDEADTLVHQVKELQAKLSDLGVQYDLSFLKSLEDRLYEEGQCVTAENRMLSARLRRILLRYASGEYQQMQELSRTIKAQCAKLDNLPKGPWMETDGKLSLDQTFSRPLVMVPAVQHQVISDYSQSTALPTTGLEQLFTNNGIPTTTLRERLQTLGKQYASYTLATVVEHYPLQYGLEELLKYLTMAMRMDYDLRSIDPYENERIHFISYPDGQRMSVSIPKVTIYGEH